jgi:hypothetical protein
MRGRSRGQVYGSKLGQARGAEDLWGLYTSVLAPESS